MELRRKFYDTLKNWKTKSNGKTALLIQGARRIGKSYIAEKFAQKEYKSYILIDFNFVDNEVKDLFIHDIKDMNMFFMKLSAIYGVTLYPRETIIILDEVQLFPRARSVVKYLVADGRYDYIETGSLISIKQNVKDILIPSEEQRCRMYPMDFEEFLWATNNSQLAELIRNCYEKKSQLGQALHRRAMNLFRQYLIVGGMPQSVLTLIETNDLSEVDIIKRNILDLYRDDINKHAKGYSTKVKAIFDEIPNQLKNQNRHFKLSSIADGARFKDYEEPLFWLSDAMIANNCYNTQEPNIGLSLNMDRTILKCYLGDTGLLISMIFDENAIVSEQIYKKILIDKLEVNLGMVLENYVAQTLASTGHKLFFFANSDNQNKENRMEIDFLIAKKNITNRHNISPIEVKSSKNYTLNSINKFRAKYGEYINTPYVLHTADFEEKDGIVYLPIYMTGLL